MKDSAATQMAKAALLEQMPVSGSAATIFLMRATAVG